MNPRFSSCLKTPYKTLAISKLVLIWERIRANKRTTGVDLTEDDEEDDDLEAFLALNRNDSLVNRPTVDSVDVNIHDLLEQFHKLKPEKAKTNVLKYWERSKNKNYTSYHVLYFV